ncbi:hypothetical protein [Lysinibacillus sp. NPDC056232]
MHKELPSDSVTSAGGFNFFQQLFSVAKAKRQLQVSFAERR